MPLQPRSPAPQPASLTFSYSKKDQAILDMLSLVEEQCGSVVSSCFKYQHAQFRRKQLSMVRFVQGVSEMFLEPYPEVWTAFTAYASTAFKKWQEYMDLCNDVLSTVQDANKHSAMRELLVELKDELVPLSSAAFLDRVQELMCGRVLCTAPMLWTAFPDLWAVLVRSTSTKQWYTRMEKLETKRRARLAKVAMPKTLCSVDVLDLVASYIPLPSLGRLATTCMWAHMNLRAERFDAAKEKLVLTHGLFDVIEPTRQLRLRSSNEEVITVKPMGKGIPSLWIHMGNVKYATVSTSEDSYIMRRIAEMIYLKGESTTTAKAWFRFEAAASNGMPQIRISCINRYHPLVEAQFVCVEAK